MPLSFWETALCAYLTLGSSSHQAPLSQVKSVLLTKTVESKTNKKKNPVSCHFDDLNQVRTWEEALRA